MSPLKEKDTSAEEIACLYQEIQILHNEISCYQELPKSINVSTSLSKKLGQFQIKTGVNFAIKKHLKNALKNCSAPPFKITSGLRPECTHSQHSKGEAVDISWKCGGKEFTKFLESKEGKQWLNKYKLDYYLENIKCKKGHTKYF
jgi:hypothetical protein